MCGIIGIVTNNMNVSAALIEGLKRLEYRGYDSAGIATLSEQGALLCRRTNGKLSQLEKEVRQSPISGTIGIGHTRWATHGSPSVDNAHPHLTDKVAVVHNGIIENFRELRKTLEDNGRILNSQTDSEVIPHLITQFLEEGMSPIQAVSSTMALLTGTYAIVILFSGKQHFLVAAKSGSPLAIGYGHKQMFVGSDAIALSPFTSRIAYLKDGDIAQVSDEQVQIWDENNKPVNRTIQLSVQNNSMLDRGNYRHYMMKEIFEQPEVLVSTIRQYIDEQSKNIRLPGIPFKLSDITQVTIVACGTSNYAGMICKYWMEKFSGLPVNVDIASEFRYREAPLKPGGLAIFISQSGETADTIAALQFAREKQQYIISIVNVTESTVAQNSDLVLPIFAGAEIGVASTKAFTAQLIVLACLTLAFTDSSKTAPEQYSSIINAIEQLPAAISKVLSYKRLIYALAQEIYNARSVLFIGRGTAYPIALEAALKLKELSYIHAEGIAAGELKHGPLALVDNQTPVIAIAPSDALFDKTCSNIHEVAARGGKVIAFCDPKGVATLKDIASYLIVLPEINQFVAPILYAVPMQLLAYYIALAKGNDVDQPRNLAKSVTVE